MKLPNTLKASPFVQKLQWVADPIKYLDKAAEQHPDIFTGEVIGFGDTLVFVNHPQGIEEVFTNDRNKFAALGEVNKTFEPIIGEYGMLMLEGERHRRERQLMMPSFHGKRMQSYAEIMRDQALNAFKKLPQGKPFSAHAATMDISLEIILEAVFGISKGERYQEIKRRLLLMLHTVSSPLTASFLLFPALQKDLGSWSPWGQFLRQRSSLDELIYAEISERRQHPNPERIDILELLMSAVDEKGNGMSDKELRDELVTMLLAGHETTASAIAWAIYWIYQLPQVRTKILKELDSLGDNPDPMSIFRLPYLTAVCNETLRICPVSMTTFPRVVQEPVKLLGHDLEPGTVVVASIYLAHRRPDLYPNPEQFQPERFLEGQFSPYEFIAFGAGARRCIGEAFAMFEMKLVLATILLGYNMEFAGDRPEKLARHGGFNLAPANGVKMVITGQRSRSEMQANMMAEV